MVVSLKVKGQDMDYIEPEELNQLNPGDTFSLNFFDDVYELVEKPKKPSYTIRHLDGTSFQHGTLLLLGSNEKVKRLSCSLACHYIPDFV